MLVCPADIADPAVEVEQAERVHIAVLFAQRSVPVDLVGQAIPGEAHGRDAHVAQAQDVGPFLPQPFNRLVAVRTLPEVGLGVHHRQAIAVVILPRDLGVAEGLAGSDSVAVGEYAVLVELVIIVAEDAVLLQPVLEEPLIFLAGHAVIQQILVHSAVDPPAVIEVERQEAHLVEHFGPADRRRQIRVIIFRRFRLDEDRVVPALEDFDHPHDVRLHQMLERGDERAVVLLLLVPPAVFGREDRADEHLVDRRIELHPREALRELTGIGSEQPREIRVLEIADPVGHAEMAQVDDRRDLAPLQLGEGEVGKLPVELVGPEISLVDRRARSGDS